MVKISKTKDMRSTSFANMSRITNLELICQAYQPKTIKATYLSPLNSHSPDICQAKKGWVFHYALLSCSNSCKLLQISSAEAAKKQYDCWFDELIMVKIFALDDRCFNLWINQSILYKTFCLFMQLPKQRGNSVQMFCSHSSVVPPSLHQILILNQMKVKLFFLLNQ